jgi:hypothetical protein
MPTQHLYGASDDLVELQGDIDEEYDVAGSASRGILVATSHGVLAQLRLERNSQWSIVILDPGPPGVTLELVPARGEDEGDDEFGCPGYSARLAITSERPCAWVLTGPVAGDDDYDFLRVPR